jgi:aminoglycoside phosphotransferase (APT) family kinase protein
VSDPVERAVRAALPDRQVAEIEAQTTRPGNETAHVTFADASPVYMKTATDTARRLRREVVALRYAETHCSVAVPEVVAGDPDADPPYLVTEPLPGRPMNDGWTGDGDREALLRAVGRAVAGVHEARPDRAGVIEGGDADDLRLAGDSWTETLCRTVEFRAADWLPDRFADLPPRLVETVRAVDPSMETPPALLHADASRINVHVDPVGLLDWERALVGDPAFDLVDAAEHHLGQPDVGDDERERLQSALYDGYRSVAGELPPGLARRRPLYRAVWHLLVLQAFEDWSADVDRPADDLAEEVREEFDGRIEAARETV